eukprot:scaffold1747_cov135-Skeletonema_menzelii.AAC.3
MSSEVTEEASETCASCGKSECDDVKLKNCNACYLVKYCSVVCQRNHRSQHKRACKIRAAELRDELLFKQPEGIHFGDCPICFIPIPTGTDDGGKLNTAAYHPCCSKMICNGCIYASRLQKIKTCPFCRTEYPSNDAEASEMLNKRVAANDPYAIRVVLAGNRWKEGKFSEAFNYTKQAAKLGDMESHQQLAHMYLEGEGVEEDVEKAIYHWEEAAIGGHPMARMSLGLIEGENGGHERQVKHFIIAAKQGWSLAVEHLMDCYKEGHVSKDEFEEALRAYQMAVDATKSPQREAAERNPDLLNVRSLSD